MAFPRRLVPEGEEMVLESRPHWVALLTPSIQTLVVIVALIGGGAHPRGGGRGGVRVAGGASPPPLLSFPAGGWGAWPPARLVVPSRGLPPGGGWLNRRSVEIPLTKISDVAYE